MKHKRKDEKVCKLDFNDCCMIVMGMPPEVTTTTTTTTTRRYLFRVCLTLDVFEFSKRFGQMFTNK